MPWKETHTVSERHHLIDLVVRNGIAISEAARTLGVSRKTAHKMLKNLAALGLGNLEHAGSIARLNQLLRDDYRGIIVTMIHKFRDIPANLNHSGFNVHQSRRIAAHECQDIERLAQYIFDCEDAGESFGRFDSLSLGNESEDQAQLSGVQRMRFHRGNHAAHSG